MNGRGLESKPFLLHYGEAEKTAGGKMGRGSSKPYWLTTKYGGVCSRCKEGIKKGEKALYYPAGKTLLCNGDSCGQQEQRNADANAFDEAMYSGSW